MKINELFENEVSLGKVKLTVDCKLNFNNSQCKYSLGELENSGAFKSILKNYFSQLYWNMTDISFYKVGNFFKLKFISILVPEQYTTSPEKYSQFFSELEKRCEKFLDTKECKFINPEKISLDISGNIQNLTHKIYVPYITYYIDDKKDAISNIDKKIQCEIFSFNANRVEGGVLSLLKIKGLKEIIDFNSTNKEWVTIVQKHLKGDRNIVDCAEELIEHGYKDFAKL